MSLLTMIQRVSDTVGVPRPTSVVSNTDQTVRTLLAFANEEGEDLRARGTWQQLVSETSFTTADGTVEYAIDDIVSDFDYFVNQSIWDRTQRWPVSGPITAQAWQAQNAFVTASPWKQFRIRDNRFIIYPTPDAADTYFFEYYSTAWCTAQAWQASTTYAANATVSSNGHRYTTTAGGTSGSTAPSHTSGSASDGGVTWTYADEGYETWQADTDIGILDETLMELGIKWRFKASKGLPFETEARVYEQRVQKALARNGGADRLRLNQKAYDVLGEAIVPQTGFGS